jgi:hypothetical protein
MFVVIEILPFDFEFLIGARSQKEEFTTLSNSELFDDILSLSGTLSLR